jgi:uncharacterized protein (DUF2126 family)
MADYVKVRLLGILPGVSAAVRVLTAAAEAEGFEVAEVSPAYPNRRDPGFRLYVTLRFPASEDTEPCRATHRRQAIRRPAAPPRRHLP